MRSASRMTHSCNIDETQVSDLLWRSILRLQHAMVFANIVADYVYYDRYMDAGHKIESLG